MLMHYSLVLLFTVLVSNCFYIVMSKSGHKLDRHNGRVEDLLPKGSLAEKQREEMLNSGNPVGEELSLDNKPPPMVSFAHLTGKPGDLAVDEIRQKHPNMKVFTVPQVRSTLKRPFT